jgi:putative acetyltransferase
MDVLHKKMITIRQEQPQDLKAIRAVIRRAFGQTQEADLVDKLRQNYNDLLSLVAVRQNKVVGHILFTPVTIESADTAVRGMALAPMAVMPEYQRQGVGAELVRAGIEQLKKRGCLFIIVLGHAEYYPRFNFEPASRYGIRSEWEVEDDTFMILVLNEFEMQSISGVARYLPEFAEAI